MGRVQVNWAHKTRFSSKSTRNVLKTSLKSKHGIAKPDRNVGKGARTARIQRNKMARDQKRAELLKAKRASSGAASPPRVIVADLIAFVASGNSFFENEDSSSYYIDSFGNQCLSVFRGVGLPGTVVLIRDLPSEIKRRHDLKKIFRSSLTSEFPEDCRFFSADTKDELHKFIWLFREQKLTVPLWRTQRPCLMAQQVDMVMEDHDPEKSTLLLWAHGLSVNQLVHISGVGEFQLRKIDVLKDPFPLNARKNCDAMDSEEDYHVQGNLVKKFLLVSRRGRPSIASLCVMRCLGPDPEKQEALLVENVPDPLAGEQTWPSEEELAEAVRNLKEKKVKKRTLPRGTSEYQAAWILEDSDSEVLENDEVDDDDDGAMVLDEETSNITAQYIRDSCFDDDVPSLNLRDSDDDTETDSMMVDGEQLTKEQIKDEIQKIKEAHAEDEEFPDEVETPLDVPARKRFAKYRGVKSFRTSSWDPKESLPPEYARIFSFENFKRTQKHVFANALEMEKPDQDDCAAAGSYTLLYVKDVSTSVASKLCTSAKTMPIVACGLLQHESKMYILHFSLKKYDSYTSPIKAKEELTFYVGFRQFVAWPIFSTDNISSDKHKMERFLHTGRFSMASIYAPGSLAPLPLIVLKNADDANSAAVAAIGSLRSVDPDRSILKRIILTGYPPRVSKLKASVRYMFHNPKDVRWFKPVEVWKKCGRRGRIKEPVGTHGMESMIKKYHQKFRIAKEEMERWSEIQGQLISQFNNASSIIERLPIIRKKENFGALNCVDEITDVVLTKQLQSLQSILLSMGTTLEKFRAVVLSLEKILRDSEEFIIAMSSQLNAKQLQQRIGLKPSLADCLDGLKLLYDMHFAEFRLKSSIVSALPLIFFKFSISDLVPLRQLLVDQPNIPPDEVQSILDIIFAEEIC